MLTKEQCICLSIMTGNTMIEAKHVLADVSQRLGRKVHPAEFNNKGFIDELKNLYYDEWLEMCYEEPHAGLILPPS